MSATTTSTPMSEVLALQRAAFHRDGPPSVAVRRDRIDRFAQAVIAHTDEIVEAISADFGNRPALATLVTDIATFAAEAEIQRAGLARWMRPRHPSGRLAAGALRLAGIDAHVLPSPLGVVGVMGMWNFPLTLTAVPAISALAAGNRVMIKMSEKVPRTAAVLADAWHDALDVEEVAVVTGDTEVSKEFAALDLDHLFFTGSAETGSKVMAAAARTLTPVTLELGGKNPVVISEDVAANPSQLRRAARRIAAARLQNGGQACIDPEEVYLPADAARSFVQEVLQAWAQTVPELIGTGGATTMIDDEAFERVTDLMEDAEDKGAQVVRAVSSDETGEEAMRRARIVPPALILGVTDEMRISREEVFGPLLAVHGYTTLDDVLTRLADRPAPLVATWFGRDDAAFRTFVARTRSGGVARNEWAISSFLPGVPFGGVGRSGMGSYHGQFGFDAFSHHRTVAGSALPVSITDLTGGAAGERVQGVLRKGVEAYDRLLRLRLRL